VKKRIVFAVVAAGVLLGAAEAALRIGGYRGAPTPASFVFQLIGEIGGEPDPVRFWRLPNVAPHFTDEGPRIIALADSVTVMEQGKGWPDMLPEALREAGRAAPVQVFNAGVPGYTSWQGGLYLQQELIRCRPKLVTIEFGWNDHWPTPYGKPDKDLRMPSAPVAAVQKALGASRVYRLMRSLFVRTPAPAGPPRVSLTDYRENLRRIVVLTRTQGGRVVLLTAPFLDGPWGWRVDHLAYNEAVREVAAETFQTLVDLTAEFRDRPDLFYADAAGGRDPVHFNQQGSRLVAAAVAKTIAAYDLLP
jgi:lysophospholipase L1-like esterase